MSELKSGGLAMIVGAVKCQENIGKVVTLGEFVRAGDFISGRKYCSEDVWVCYGEGLVTHSEMRGVTQSEFAIATSDNLMPINPEADPLETTQKESEHVR